MPQTTYNLTPIPAQAGQRASGLLSAEVIVSGVAGVVIPPGVLCETYSSGGKILVRPVQDTGTTTTYLPALIGISYLDILDAEQGYTTYPVPPSTTGSSFAGYPIGSMVPFMRRGTIWASWDGNTGVALPTNGAINVWHSSDGTHAQGVFTTIAAQTTPGAEIDAAGAYINVFDPNQVSGAYTDSFGNVVDIVRLEINLPGHS